MYEDDSDTLNASASQTLRDKIPLITCPLLKL